MGNVSENEANKHQSHDLSEKASEESNEQEYQGNTINTYISKFLLIKPIALLSFLQNNTSLRC